MAAQTMKFRPMLYAGNPGKYSLVIWYKRLEVGSFQNLEPTPGTAKLSGSAGIELSVTDLALILNGIDLATARRRKRYCRVG